MLNLEQVPVAVAVEDIHLHSTFEHLAFLEEPCLLAGYHKPTFGRPLQEVQAEEQN